MKDGARQRGRSEEEKRQKKRRRGVARPGR